jgi:cob(I)alamin adenosyltransferase
VELDAAESVNPLTLRYVNRLSDWLFAAPRLENNLAGVPEPLWKPGA